MALSPIPVSAVPRRGPSRPVPLLTVVGLVLALLVPVLPLDPAAAAARPTLTAPTAVDARTKVRLRGTAPARTGVVVQVRVGKRWAPLGEATASAKGRWSTTVLFRTAGTATVRALVGKRASRVRTIDVYDWIDLAPQPFVSEAAGRDVPLQIGGRSYPHSIQAVDPGTYWPAAWRLDGACTDLRATVGFLDPERSTSDQDETIQTRAIGQRADDTNGPLIGPVDSTWDAPGRLRLSGLRSFDRILVVLGITDPGDNDNLSGALGTPQARCRVPALPPLQVSDFPSA
ncbi:hypothetical protein [Nocardioides sp.]|uniref:hypothetical protein n=1 Tax=Nocardioides sp. TaxID=35761 RepID=UPI003518B76F